MGENAQKPDMDADMLAIRAMLTEAEAAPLEPRRCEAAAPEAARPVRPARPAAAPMQPDRPAPMAEMVEDAAPSRRSRRNTPRPDLGGAKAAAMARIKGYRPTRRHIAFAVILVLAVMRPWLLVALILLPIVIVTGLFLAVGPEGFWAGALRGFRRYAARRPERAEALRARADAFALRWDAFLDRFPEGYVDALYFPDLDSLAKREEQTERAIDDRFEKLRQDARGR